MYGFSSTALLAAISFLAPFGLGKKAESTVPAKCERVQQKKSDAADGSMQIKLIVNGIPPNTPAELTTIRLNGKSAFPAALKINEKGEVILAANQEPLVLTLYPYSQESLHGFSQGEPVQYKVTVDKGKAVANVTIIPFPNEAKDDVGHYLCVDCNSKDKRTFAMKATGFEPYEVVDIISVSDGQLTTMQGVADENGELFATLTPAISGKKTGKASYEIKGKTTRSLKVSYDWGL